jgi:hypothetical protein
MVWGAEKRDRLGNVVTAKLMIIEECFRTYKVTWEQMCAHNVIPPHVLKAIE